MRSVALCSLLLAVAVVALSGQRQASRTVWDRVYTLEQAERGKHLYAKVCASCHGADLLGNPDTPPASPALYGSYFNADWARLPVGQLWTRIKLSMPTGSPGVLSGAQAADITAYLLNANGYPEGTTELPAMKERLDAIRFGQ